MHASRQEHATCPGRRRRAGGGSRAYGVSNGNSGCSRAAAQVELPASAPAAPRARDLDAVGQARRDDSAGMGIAIASIVAAVIDRARVRRRSA
jgi:hypothetical protein